MPLICSIWPTHRGHTERWIPSPKEQFLVSRWYKWLSPKVWQEAQPAKLYLPAPACQSATVSKLKVLWKHRKWILQLNCNFFSFYNIAIFDFHFYHFLKTCNFDFFLISYFRGLISRRRRRLALAVNRLPRRRLWWRESAPLPLAGSDLQPVLWLWQIAMFTYTAFEGEIFPLGVSALWPHIRYS